MLFEAFKNSYVVCNSVPRSFSGHRNLFPLVGTNYRIAGGLTGISAVILCCEVFSCCRGSPPRPFSGATATGRVAARGDLEPPEDTYILNLAQPTTTCRVFAHEVRPLHCMEEKNMQEKRHFQMELVNC